MIDQNLRRSLSTHRTRTIRRTPLHLVHAAGRAPFALEQVEPRVMLAGDHPSLPGTWGPFPPGPTADAVTLDTVSAATNPLRGRGQINGTITAGDPGDLFKFVVPATAGRTKDFVTVLADTIGPASTLDTYVEVYDSTGNLLVSGADNGTLSLGLYPSLLPPNVTKRAPDGWAGFEGTVGATYYVRVKADPVPDPTRTITGNYTLKIDAATVGETVNTDPDVMSMGQTFPNIDFGRAFADNSLAARQEDIIYRVTTPDDARFNSLATFQAVSDDNSMLNPHVDVYSAGNTQGVVQRLTFDQDAGRQNDSFTTYLTARNTTYYIRVRADDLRLAPTGQPLGEYQMITRFSASNIPIDPETRLGQTGMVVTAHDDPADPWTNVPLRSSSMNMNPGFPRQGTDSQLFQFTAQGTGLCIVTVVAQGAQRPATMDAVGALPQPAMRLYSEDGTFLDFNKGNGSAQLLFSVTGDHTYYLVMEGFDNAADGGFKVFIEAHHTNDPTNQGGPVDDHINTPATGYLPNWEFATPLRFGDAFQQLDQEGNPARDEIWKQTATGRGRIQDAGDTDLFQFTAPVPQLDTYPGDDGNQTTPLYVGGNFAQSGTDPRTGMPYNSANSAIFDGGSWWGAGGATEALGAINGPIFAMAVWNVTGATGNNTQVLAVGGRFTAVAGGPAGNIAFRVFDQANGRYLWSTDPLDPNSANPIMINGPVFALGSGEVIPTAIQGFNAPELYVGGQFTSFTSNNVLALADVGGAIGVSNLNGGVTGAGAAVRAITFFDPPAQQWPSKPAAQGDNFTNAPPALADAPTQVYFGGTFANGFATNPAIVPYPNSPTPPPTPPAITPPGTYPIADPALASPDVPGPITGLNNVARWGVRNLTGDLNPTLQGNGLPNGYNITWGDQSTLDENFDDEQGFGMPPMANVPTGSVLGGSNIRVDYTAGTANLTPTLMATDKQLAVTGTTNFTFTDGMMPAAANVQHSRVLLAFTPANTGANGITSIVLLRAGAVVSTLTGAALQARRAQFPYGTPPPPVNLDTFQLDLPTGFDQIRVVGNGTIADIQVLATLGIATATGFGVTGGANVSVNAMTIWDDQGMYPSGPLINTAIPARIIIAGSFTNTGAVAASPGPAPVSTAAPAAVNAVNIIAYNPAQVGNGAVAAPAPGLLGAPRFESIGNIAAGPVRALATWNAAVVAQPISNEMSIPVLLAGGDNGGTTAGVLQELVSIDPRVASAFPPPFTVGAAWTPIASADDGTIRTIVTFKNDGIGVAPGTNPDGTLVDFETIYMGGDFTSVTDLILGNQFDVNHVARMELRLTDPVPLQWTDMGGGTVGVSPGEAPGTISGVYALSTFQDNITGVWDRNERAATKVAITLSPTLDSRLSPTTQIRVFDSNFNLIYTNNQLDPTNMDPVSAGSNDPSFIPTFPNAGIPYWVQPSPPFPGFSVWGGEVYYVEVSDPGNGTGRYTLAVTTDALAPRPNPTDPNTGDSTGVFPDGISTYVQPVGKGQFATAPEINLGGDGKGRAFLDPLADPNNTASYSVRPYNVTPGGVQRTEFWDSPIISRVTDTQIYFFRAQNDGAAEIRLSTFGIVDGYQEIYRDQNGNLVSQNKLEKRINSPLHGAIRVYDNDFVQVGYSNGNNDVGGFGDIVPTLQPNANVDPPEDGNRAFLHSDPRLVINVRRGNVYFIEVESAFKGVAETNPDLVDWRFATGAYDLTVNSTPSLGGVDDAWPNFDTGGIAPPQINVLGLISGTPIPVDRTTGLGSISGVIHNIPTGPFANPNDQDQFTAYAEGRGFFTVRVTPTSPLLSPRVRVYDSQAMLVSTASGGVGLAANLQFPVSQGQKYFIVVDGSGTEGSYVVDVSTPEQGDDQKFSNADPNDLSDPLAFWANAKQLQLNRFLGVYGDQTNGTGAISALNGNIENPDDHDLYKFTAESYEIATVNITHVDPSLNPRVYVYEINRDGSGGGTPMGGVGMEVFLLIATNDDTSGTDSNSLANFSITPGRDYYVLVVGSNLDTDFGRYQLAVHVQPSDDHPNDPLLAAPTNTPDPTQANDFPNGSIIPITFDPINFTSTGTSTGTIERNTDTDLFRFTAQATGNGVVTLSRSGMSTLALDVVVLDSTNQPIAGITFSGSASSITSSQFSIIQGQQYYLLVRPNASAMAGVSDTGAYSLNITTTPIDDYLPTPGTSTPSAGDFAGAPNIALGMVNGIGTINGTLVPTGDSDLFKFSTIMAGAVTVRISTPLSTLNPQVIIFDASHVQVFSAAGNGDSASVTFNASASSQQYFVLVLADSSASGITGVGGYTVTVSSSTGPGPGPGMDDYPNAGEWADAANIGLDTRTGEGGVTANISPAGDTDLFKFTVPGNGIVDLQLNTPAGGLVDGQLRIFNAAHTQVFFDSAGILGSTAAIRIPGAIAGDLYFVLVEPVGTATGSYTLRIAAQPVTHFLYFPEGFTGSTIDEFVPMLNPNSYPIDVQVFARYETGANPNTPIWSGTIPANSRGGITVSTRDNPSADLVRPGVGYSLEIQSTGPMGATFSHYDFDTAVGESFTNRISTVWTFAEANKDHNNFRDFLLYYNPGNTTAHLNISLYYQDGTVSTFAATVDSLRRGGINFDNNTLVTRSGKFGIRVDSDQPIVASVTSYDLARTGGDGVLGDADGGNTVGVVTNITSGGGAFSTVSILNTNSQPATVTITADYGRTDIPKLVRVYTVAPNSQLNKNLAAVGLLPGQTAGITYSSNVPVTFQALEYKFGDGDSTTTATSVARDYFFGDLFVNPSLAGIKYIEQLGLYNPGQVSIDVAATFLFNDGTTAPTTFHVGPGTFSFVSIDQQPAIIGHNGLAFFSLVLDSASPFIASLTHYDLFLNGGWSALGAPIGLTNPLNTLS